MSESNQRIEALRQELLEYYFECHPQPEIIRVFRGSRLCAGRTGRLLPRITRVAVGRPNRKSRHGYTAVLQCPVGRDPRRGPVARPVPGVRSALAPRGRNRVTSST